MAADSATVGAGNRTQADDTQARYRVEMAADSPLSTGSTGRTVADTSKKNNWDNSRQLYHRRSKRLYSVARS